MSSWNTSEGWGNGIDGAVSGASVGSFFGPIGAVAGGLLGGLGGLFGTKKSPDWNAKAFKESQRQFNVIDDYNKNITQYRVQDALKAGINPLAALGQSANYSPTISGGGFSSTASQNNASKFANAISKIFTRQETQSRDLDLEAKRLRNQVIREELRYLQQPGLPLNGGAQLTPAFRPDGRKMLYDVAYDLQGRPRLMVNQDVTENDSDNAGYRSALASAFASGQINPVSGRVRSRQLQMLIDDMYYQSTGRHITNLDELYISPTELGFAVSDELQGWFPSKGKK